MATHHLGEALDGPLTSRDSDHVPDLTSASGSPQSSQSDNSADLEELRRQNEEKLQGRFQAIYAKYSHDFADVTDEIDLVTGQVTFSNGHLKYMRHERDIGPARRKGQGLTDDGNEPVADESPIQTTTPSIASLINSNLTNWSKPGAFDQYFSDSSKDHVTHLVENAIKERPGADTSDPSFLQTFTRNIIKEVSRLTQSVQPSENDNLKALSPSVVGEQIVKQRSAPNDLANEKDQTAKWEPSIWEDTEFDFSLSRSVSAEPDEIDVSSQKALSRKGVLRWTKDEDACLVSLKNSGRMTYREISLRFPNRSFRAVRSRFRALTRRPSSLSALNDSQQQSTIENADTEDRRLTDTGTSSTTLQDKDSPQLSRSRDHFSSKRIWTPADDQLIVRLREKDKLVWREIAHYFPGRSLDAVAWRYYFRLQKGAKRPVHQSDESLETNGAQDHSNSGKQILSAEVDPAQDSAISLSRSESESAVEENRNQDQTSRKQETCKLDSLSEHMPKEHPSSKEASEEHSSLATYGSSKKRKRYPENEFSELPSTEPCYASPQVGLNNEDSVPIDPMLLDQVESSNEACHDQTHSSHPRDGRLKILRSDGPSPASHDIHNEIDSERFLCVPLEQVGGANLTPRRNVSIPLRDMDISNSTIETPNNGELANSSNTPSRQAQWSFVDALIQNKPEFPVTRISVPPSLEARTSCSHAEYDLNDGLGSEDELAH